MAVKVRLFAAGRSGSRFATYAMDGAGCAASATGADRAAARASVIMQFIFILQGGQALGADRAGGDRHPPVFARIDKPGFRQ